MDFIDVQCGFGGFKPGVREEFTAEMLIEQLDFAGIGRGLARILPFADDADVEYSNEKLYNTCAKYSERLIPCPVVVPDILKEFGGEEAQVKMAAQAGAGAVFLRPTADGWLPETWVCTELMAALAKYNLPAFMTASVSMADVAKLATAFPEVNFIYSDINYRMLRTLLPLMATHKNVYVSTGCNFNFHNGYEAFERTVGTEHLLFGTGLPVSEPGAAMAFLTYSTLSDDTKQAIASGNYLNLFANIRREA